MNDNSTENNVFDSLPAYRTLSHADLDELSRFMHSSPEEVSNENLLAWWNDHRREYPHLSRMALDYLTIPSKLQFINLAIILTSEQVHLLTWSASSAKDASFYPTFATACLQKRLEHSSA
jgi:hypothetical protein